MMTPHPSLPTPLSPSAVLPDEAAIPFPETEDGLPTLSLVVPLYNAGLFLERTLRSLAFNLAPGIEVIVMDGASTDETPLILDHYASLFTSVTSAPDTGQSDALNKGFLKSNGDILGWLNGDDLLAPGALSIVRRAFDGTADVLVGDALMTEADLSVIHTFRFSEARLTFDALLSYGTNHLVQPSVFFSRRAFAACGPLDEALHYSMDADIFLKMAARYRFAHIPKILSTSVFHPTAKTRARRAEAIGELALVVARHGGLEAGKAVLTQLYDLFDSVHTGSQPDKQSLLDKVGTAFEEEAAKNRALLLSGEGA